MNHFTTRTGGESGTQAGNLIPAFAIHTAGAPASPLLDSAPDSVAGRAPASSAPEWIELLPSGVFYGRDGRGPFRIVDPVRLIEATVALGMNAGLPIDYDHATDFGAPEGRPAPAAGWIREFGVRDGALWGRVEWTARASESIAAREYRYVSPVFQFDPKDGAVTRLLRAGLTNNPNLHLTAIAAACNVVADDKDSTMDVFTKELREVLGLDDSASPEAVVAKARELRAAADSVQTAVSAHSADPAHFVAVAQFERALTELNALRAERALERASHTVEDAIRAGKLVPAQRDWAVSYCAANAGSFQAFVAKQPSIIGAELPLSGEPSSSHRATALSAAEIGICAQLGLKHSEFRGRKSGRADFLSIVPDADDRPNSVRGPGLRNLND